MEVYYMNSKNEKIELSGWPLMIQEPEKLFSHKWSYKAKSEEKNGGKIERFYKNVTEKSATISVFAESKADYEKTMKRFSEACELDIIENSPGKLYINDLYMKCFIFESDYSEYEEDFYTVEKEISIVSGFPFWIKETSYVFRTDVSLPSTGGKKNLDFPYDFKCDFSSSMVGRTINNTGIAPANFEITIYGACLNPYINIGGETYRVYASLDTGEYLKINSITKKIYKVKVNGEVVNQFNLRDRDPQPYFRKISPGINAVTWSGAYGVDVTLFEERSEPEWT